MSFYKYRLIITNDKEKIYYLIDTKEEICQILNISRQILNRILLGQIKKKYNFIDIKQIYMPPNKKGYEEEHKKAVHKEACIRYNLNKKKDDNNINIDNILNKLKNKNDL